MTRGIGIAGVALVAAVVAGAGAACGDDDGGGDGRQAYVDAFVASGSDEALSDDENECFAAAIVDAVGVEKLRGQVTADEVRDAQDALPGDLGIEVSEDEGEAFYDGVSECLDVPEYFATQIEADDSLTAENKACLREAFGEDFLHDFYVTLYIGGADGFQADSDLMDHIQSAYEGCNVTL
jgi:hypothetical protein